MMVSNINNNLGIRPHQSIMSDVVALIENEIPECQQNLRDNNHNLAKVAEYCEDNYFTSSNKPLALEETKSYAIQSLASVAYQITSLSFNILHLFDQQANQVTTLESQLNHLAQAEQIRREKVARREISLFITNRPPNRKPKITYPANPERPAKYVRTPIDYSILDDVGHGAKLLAPSQQQPPIQDQLHTSRTWSISSAQSINDGGSLYGPGMSVFGHSEMSIHQAPSTRPPTPPQTFRSVGSLSRASKEYRSPALSFAPPQVPINYAPDYPIYHLNSAPNMMQPSQSQQQQQQQNFNSQQQQQSQQYDIVGMVQPRGEAPPCLDMYSTGTIRYGQSILPPPPSTAFERAGAEPDWVPKSYIEKVIALYDYTKEKPDELNLCENAIIYVTKKNDDGWYEGVLDGEEGLFPSNYVEPLRDC